MAQHPWLDPSGFAHPGGATGALLLHGFTGAPTEMRPLGDFLAAHGYAVACPLLPGHGTQPADLNQVHWQDWTAAVESAYRELAGRTEKVFVAGLSMGGLLAMHLAAQRPEVCGLLLYAPGLRVNDWRLPLAGIVKHLRPLLPKDELSANDAGDPETFDRIWCYDMYPVGGAHQLWRLQRAVRRHLPEISQPLIIFQGRLDRAIRPDNPATILQRAGSADTSLVWLENSGHNLVLDAQRQAVFEASLAWIRQREAISDQNQATRCKKQAASCRFWLES